MLVSLKELKGLTIQAKDGEIGKVNDAYFDDQAWVVRYLIDKTGFWLFSRQVLISPASVQAIDMEKHQIQVDLTRDQVENSPKVDKEKPLTRDAEKELISYYEWPTYLGIGGIGVDGAGVGGTDTHGAAYGQSQAPFPFLLRNPRNIVKDKESDGPNVISTDDVLGYPISTNDGDLGFVADFIVDSKSWEIRYLIIETGKHLKDKKILIDPEWIDWISWKMRRIRVSMDREKIKACPSFDLSLPIQREYEAMLYDHYECKKYWERKEAES